MERYKYKAKDENGKIVNGIMQAMDEVDLHKKLKKEGKLLISAKTDAIKIRTRRLKSNAISEYCKNLGELIGAGVPLFRALKILSEDEATKPKQRDLYKAINKQVVAGTALSDAMEMQGDAFPPLLINMFRSAESSGNIDKVALQMADYYDKDYRLKQKVKSSMTYPKILGVLIVVVVAIIMGYVIPQFETLFSQMEQLPMSTTILLAISDFVKNRWYILVIGAFIIYVASKALIAIPSVRYQIDKLKIKLPKIGHLNKIIYTARFAGTLSSLYSSGLSIINCLEITQTTIGNAYIEKQFEQVIADIRSGQNLSDSIDKVDGFTKKLTSTMMVGEETGTLDRMLLSVANQMEYDSEAALNRLVSYLEPVMIVIMAAVVAFVIISVIQPIYGSYETISVSY